MSNANSQIVEVDFEQAQKLHAAGMQIRCYLMITNAAQPVAPPSKVTPEVTNVQGTKTNAHNRTGHVMGHRVLQWVGKKSEFSKDSKIGMAYAFFHDYFLNMPVEQRCATRTQLQKVMAEWAILNEKFMPEANYLTTLIQNGYFLVKK